MIKKQHLIILAILGMFTAVVSIFSNDYTQSKNLVVINSSANKDHLATKNFEGEYISFAYPSNWSASHNFETSYESIFLKSDDSSKSNIEITIQFEDSQKNYDNEKARDEFSSYLASLKKEYEVNQSGELDSIENIYIKNTPAVKYKIYDNTSESKTSQVDSIYAFKDGKKYLLRLNSSGNSTEELSVIVSSNLKILDSIVDSVEFK